MQLRDRNWPSGRYRNKRFTIPRRGAWRARSCSREVDRRRADRAIWAGSTFFSGGGTLRDGMRGPDFRFGAHETRAEQPPDDHPCPRETECSWGFARGFLAAPCRDVPAETERRRTWGSNGCGHLSWDPIGSMSSPQCGELRKPIGSHERGRQPIDPKRAILPRWRHTGALS